MRNPPEKQVKEFLKASNAIEGVYDTDSFNQAMLAWDFLYNQSELTIGVVLKTHKILMLNQPLQPDERGYFRKCEVRIGNRFGLNAILVPEAMEKWVANTDARMLHYKKAPVPMVTFADTLKDLHVEYEKIHPFVDGNGRTGRMFLNWCRAKSQLPLLIIHTGAEQQEYYKWFR